MSALDALKHSLGIKNFLWLLGLGTDQHISARWLVFLGLVRSLLSFMQSLKNLLHTSRMATMSTLHNHHRVMDLELNRAQMASFFLRLERQLRFRHGWGSSGMIKGRLRSCVQSLLLMKDFSSVAWVKSLMEQSLLTKFYFVINLLVSFKSCHWSWIFSLSYSGNRLTALGFFLSLMRLHIQL